MRLLLLFICLQSFFLSATAQINVKVRSTGNSKEIDIKTSGKSNTNKGNENANSEPKSSQPPVVKNEGGQTKEPVTNSDTDYKGPGKIYIKNFWKQVETFQSGKGTETILGNMKRALANLKDADPSYNVNKMEEEYNKWKAEIDKVVEAGKTAEQKAADKKVNGYAGPAAKQVAYFWEMAVLPVDKLSEGELNGNIRDMEYAVKATKEKDPSYNVAEMETVLKKTKDDLKAKKLAEVRQNSGDRTKPPPTYQKEITDPTKLLSFLFIETNISVGGTGDLPEAPAKIAAYKNKLEKLLSMDYTDAIIKEGKSAKARISGFKNGTNTELEKAERHSKEVREKSGMEYAYYTLQYLMTFWDGAQKVFPEDASYVEMYKKVNALVVKVGSLEQLYATAEANQKEYIKNTKLPAAVAKDAKLEKLLTDGFNKLYSASRNVNALKAVLTQNGWTTLRNSLTGIVVGRERSAKLAYKASDGKCYLLDDYVFIREDYVGGSFINTAAVFNGLFSSEMLCENVK